MRRVWLWTRGLGLWPSFSLLLRRFCIFCDRCWLPGAVHLIRTQTQNFYIGSCQLSPSGSGILRSINQSGYNCPIQWKLGSAPIERPHCPLLPHRSARQRPDRAVRCSAPLSLRPRPPPSLAVRRHRDHTRSGLSPEWMWCEEAKRRERGELSARRFQALARSRRAASLALSNRKEIATPHHGAVNSLQVPFFPILAPPPIARYYPLCHRPPFPYQLRVAPQTNSVLILRANSVEKMRVKGSNRLCDAWLLLVFVI